MAAYFYAVRVGRHPGIYQNWPDCAENVKGYPGAIYKKFKQLEEAESFIKSSTTTLPKMQKTARVMKRVLPLIPDLVGEKRKRMAMDLGVKKRITDEVVGPAVASSSSSSNIVYCDGCCFNNGFQNARAGIGIYWSYPNLSSVSERLSGKQTNQRAELVAACKALESASDHNLETIEIRTDSMYTIDVITNWINKWKRNEWKTSSGDEVKNKEDIVKLDHLNSQLRVKWTHIRGHAGDVGNETADKLAKAGALAEC